MGGQAAASAYWSSSSNANNSNNAWNVNFNNGNVNNNNKTNSYYVRAVRSGKCALLSFASVYRAYLDCRKRKQGTINALRFSTRLLDNLSALALELQNGTYRPSRSVCFVTETPKLREIFAADFRDRVVHHLLVRELEKTWEPRFIHDSYACRPYKGIHAAVKRLQRFMGQATRNGNIAACYLQLDIRSFFMSIDKNILFAIFERSHTPDVVLYLLEVIIFHDCTKDYRFKGDPGRLAQIPPHKTLFRTGPDRGLPIGNLTSQFFANVYLNELDRFVKHGLRCRHYIRYVDDFVLLSRDPDQLIQWRRDIAAFLKGQLALDLKDDGRLARVSEGVDFLGYIVMPGFMLVRNRVVNNLKTRLTIFEKRIVGRQMVGKVAVVRLDLDLETVSALHQVLASYLGHFKHANAFTLTQWLFARRWWINVIFDFSDGRLTDRLHPTCNFKSLRRQVNFFKARLPGHILLFRVGSFLEIYGRQACETASVLHCTVKPKSRGMANVAGLPQAWRQRAVTALLKSGYQAAVIDQAGPGRRVQKRFVAEIWRTVKS